MENSHHQPGGGNVKIIHKPLDIKDVKSKIGSLNNSNYLPKRSKRKIPHNDVSRQDQNICYAISGANKTKLFKTFIN